MKSVENLSLSNIVTLKPEAASLLEMHNLDFCCHGKQTLAQALEGNTEKLGLLINELNLLFQNSTEVRKIKYENMSLSQLIDYILDVHHSFVRDNASLIYSHVKKIAEKHGNRHPELIQVADLFLDVKLDLEQHMIKEEVILFPRIRQIETGKFANTETGIVDINGPVHVMESEHENAGNILHEIKKITNNYTPPDDACTTYKLAFDELRMFEHDLHQHIHLENNILFPRAMKMQGFLN
jgi:regulator of cell morphogenesis and NO signaling